MQLLRAVQAVKAIQPIPPLRAVKQLQPVQPTQPVQLPQVAKQVQIAIYYFGMNRKSKMNLTTRYIYYSKFSFIRYIVVISIAVISKVDKMTKDPWSLYRVFYVINDNIKKQKINLT
jgi:hypothetical protein